jgi:N-acetylmuramoyl-L-alanine amidase
MPEQSGPFADAARQAKLIRRALVASQGVGGDDFGERLAAELVKRPLGQIKPTHRVGGGPQLQTMDCRGAAAPQRVDAPQPRAVTDGGGLQDRPAGSGARLVKEQDCLYRIASETGHCWETLWDDPANAALRQARENPGVLLPGDQVHVPPLREKFEPGATETRHRFRRKSQPSLLHVVVKDNDEPRRNEPYVLTLDGGVTFEGFTDAEGQIVRALPPMAQRGELRVGADSDTHHIEIGRLDPLDSLRGVRQRLTNLGLACRSDQGALDDETRRQLRAFQRINALPETGAPDEATRAALATRHGS